MQIRVLFFGATADETGKRLFEYSTEDGGDARSVFDAILNTFPKLQKHKLLFAVNQQYVSGDHVLNDGDELAVFTAVSGG